MERQGADCIAPGRAVSAGPRRGRRYNRAAAAVLRMHDLRPPEPLMRVSERVLHGDGGWCVGDMPF